MIEAKNCDFLTYILSELSAQFQLENCALARLGSARNLHSLGLLELENSSSNSSLIVVLHKLSISLNCNSVQARMGVLWVAL